MKTVLTLLCLSSMLCAGEPSAPKPETTATPQPSALDKKFIASSDPIVLAGKASQGWFNYLRSKTKEFDAEALKLPQIWRAVYTTSLLASTTAIDGLGDFFENTDNKLNAVLGDDLRFIWRTALCPALCPSTPKC